MAMLKVDVADTVNVIERCRPNVRFLGSQLQQLWSVTFYKQGKPSMQHDEWRDVPVETAVIEVHKDTGTWVVIGPSDDWAGVEFRNRDEAMLEAAERASQFHGSVQITTDKE